MRAEGFGDRRYGHDNRVDLAGDLLELNPADGYLRPEQSFGEGVVDLADNRGLTVWDACVPGLALVAAS